MIKLNYFVVHISIETTFDIALIVIHDKSDGLFMVDTTVYYLLQVMLC